jgi:hypothetical protein
LHLHLLQEEAPGTGLKENASEERLDGGGNPSVYEMDTGTLKSRLTRPLQRSAF